MKSYYQLGTLLTSALAFSACTSTPKEEPQKPLNIIHIMCDDHSFQTISAYGHPISQLAPTPNIDRLAAKGMIFNKAFVENSLSTPSRACLMTGLYSHQNGQRFLGKGIDTTKVFFSELLQKQGYQTAVVGKWHMHCEPKGFDFYSVLDDQGDYYSPEFKSKNSNGKFIKENGYVTNAITDHAIEFLEQRDKNKPFCMLVHHKAPHRNWMPDTLYTDLYEDVEFPYPATFHDDYSTRTEAAHAQRMHIGRDMNLVYDLKVDELFDEKDGLSRLWKSFYSRLNDKQHEAWVKSYKPKNEKFISQNLKGDDLLKWKYQRYIKDYVRVIKSVDDQVGRLLDYLEKNNLMDNTVIVYTSDQGFYMGEHCFFDKRFMYEESFRTPLIVYYPNKTKPGSVCNELVQNIDFAPTYLDIAGVKAPETMEGRSLSSIFEGKTPADWRKDLYYHYYDPGHHVCRHDGVRDNRYKLIHFYGKFDGKMVNSNEFYDLQNDPNELNNLYNNDEYKKEIDRLQLRLDQYRKDLKVDEY